ncbi:MAG: hypothetical protein K6A23_13595 [Butyrivibrio sp.]|nr:hypothetical protein [Butyrivibrio sp.]
MGKIFELNLKGLNQLMKSMEMQQALNDAGREVEFIAGETSGETYGHRTHVDGMRWIAVCNVYPETPEARKDNFENNTLLKALGNAGLHTHK